MSENITTVKYDTSDGKNVLRLCGRIDSSNAEASEKLMLSLLPSPVPDTLVIDASDLEYISSAGLRILMRLRKQTNKKLPITETAQPIYEIFEVTGFTELFDISKKMRRISVDGCEIIGRGFYGTVYRIDEETIVKVYKSADSLSMIQNEKRLARLALIAGVPTAISYDIVRVGDSYGSVFELLRAKNFNDLLIEHPEDTDIIIRQYAEFMHLVNSRTVEDGSLGSAKQKFLGYLDTASRFLTPQLTAKLRALFEAVPEMPNIVHGDSQMKNIMLTDGEPMLIDMDTLSAGHPIFDIQSVYITYFAFEEDDPENSMSFLGVPQATAERVWERFVGDYFGSEDQTAIGKLRDKITLVGCVRFLFLIADDDSELTRTRVSRTVSRLTELIEKVTDLTFD